MKYKKKFEKDIKSDFLLELLKERKKIENTTDLEILLNPTEDDEADCELLDNMKEGYELLMRHLRGSRRVLIIVDSDFDGFSSAALFYNYLKDHFSCECDYHIPEGKEHGLRSVMNLFGEDRKWDLIVCPDAGSNDYEEHLILKNMGYDILCLDHHQAESYSKDAVVINNQLSELYPNKALSGVGVVYKFFEYVERRKNWPPFSKNYLDLVVTGQCADMMDMNTQENRFITEYGTSHFNNPALLAFIQYQKYSLYSKKAAEELTIEEINNKPLTQIQIAFYIAPLVNALIRMGSIYDKEQLFRAFIDGEQLIPSTKYDEEGLQETIARQCARNCASAKTKQNSIKQRAANILDIQISNNCLELDKIMILNVEETDAPNTMTGLCAAEVVSRYKKPVLLGRTTPDQKYLKGSGRNVSGSEFADLKAFLEESGLMEFAQGHANAFGFSIKKSNISKLRKYAKEKLADIDFNENFYEVDYVLGSKDNISDLIFDLDKGKVLWGQENPEPQIIIKNIPIRKADIQVCGKNLDTVRFNHQGVTYIKFKTSDIAQQLETLSEQLYITVIGTANINEWQGSYYPQIMIKDWEIQGEEIFAF